MTLNPLRFAEQVNQQYRRYQLTSNRLSDPRLKEQLVNLLWENDPNLWKYLSVKTSNPTKRTVAAHGIM